MSRVPTVKEAKAMFAAIDHAEAVNAERKERGNPMHPDRCGGRCGCTWACGGPSGHDGACLCFIHYQANQGATS